MALPSLDAVKITVNLLDQYKDEELVEKAMKLEYKYQTPEEFLREHFAQNDYSEELQDEVAEFFFKISKYRRYLTIIEGEILKEKACIVEEFPVEMCGRSPLNLALLYLLIFELNELTRSKVEELLLSLSKERALLVLTTLKKSETINRLFHLGSKIWDIDFVKEVLKNALRKDLFEGVYETVAKTVQKVKTQKKKLTVPVGPKCLSYPKRFKPPPPEEPRPMSKVTRIPVLIKARPVPSSTYIKHSNHDNLRKISQKNREDAKKKYDEAQRKAFRCAKVDRSAKSKKLIAKVEAAKCKIPVRKQAFKCKVIRRPEIGSPKKTAAVILREGARLLKLEQEEIKRYENLAKGGFNEDIIIELQKEMREESFRKQVEEMEKKHLEVLLAYEEALISKQKHLLKKKESADEFRKERENWLSQLETLRKEEQLRVQESIERGKSCELGAKQAMECVKKAKQKLALETMEESKALRERWLREKEEDLRRKVQVIKEIKALQALGSIRKKQVVLSEASNVGYLYEMSLEELKERLFILKLDLQEELEKRQAKVKMRRECRKEIINSYQELIQSHQKIVQEQKQKSEADKRAENLKKKASLPSISSSLDCLREKLSKKRRERIKTKFTLS